MEPRKPKSPLKDNVSGNYFYPVTTMDQIIVNETTRLDDYSIFKNKAIQTSILSNNWIKKKDRYMQLITIEGLTETLNVGVKVAYTDNLEKDLLIKKSANCIKYAIQNGDDIIFYCFTKKPNVDIPIEIEVKI